jgi:HK97 family phage prohead protease
MARRSLILKTDAGSRVYLPGGARDRCFRARDVDGIMRRLADLGAGKQVRDAAAAELAEGEQDADVATFVISTRRVDSYNSTLNPNGWKRDDFLANPVVLFGHDQSSLPVAQDIANFVDENERLIGTARFTTADLYSFGNTVGRMVRAGFLRTASVGFDPLAYVEAEDRAEDDDQFTPVDFTEQQLLEWSVVPVPANADCLVQDRSGIPEAQTRAFLGELIERGMVVGLAREAIENIRRGFGAAPIVSLGKENDDMPKETPKPVAGLKREADKDEITPATEPLREGEALEAEAAAEQVRAPLTCPECGYSGEPAEFEGGPEELSAEGDEAELPLDEQEMARAIAEAVARASQEAFERGRKDALREMGRLEGFDD